ncbi:uncharacterized protein DNG_01409 [Cephalotrichum gorgonifer]|uniref:SNF2_N domain-containing protein/Helicase_C domain-containing protein n=1 Tax=Cephalotrichum gorgonifer TaxID=2041049 RepID=A0AAE8MQH5_9PEZI|nr:uncharacterized protein DNG_01409 [Cephalotrichum gorgonifer]
MSPLRELFLSIGVGLVPHHFNLSKAIATLKKRSPAYRRWKQQEDGAEHTDAQGPTYSPLSSTAPPTTSAQLLLPASNGIAHPPPAANITPSPHEDVVIGDTRASPEQKEIHLQPAINSAISGGSHSGLEHDVRSQPPKKKRRIEPTAVSSGSGLRSGLFIVHTEADEIEANMTGGAIAQVDTIGMILDHPDRSLDSPAFLGPTGLRWEDVLTNLPDDAPEFSITGRPAPHGHVLRVNRALKALLRGDKREVRRMANTFHSAIDPDSALGTLIDAGNGDQLNSSDDDDPVLGVFGQEPGDDDIDPQTLREMEEERDDIEREERRNKTLTEEEASEEIQDAIDGLISDWRDRKLPVLERKAYRIWTQARQDRSLRHRIQSSTAFLAHLNSRIAKIRQELLNSPWTSPQSCVRLTRGHMEQSVFDQQYHSWLIDTLNGPMPTRPTPAPRPPKAKRNLRLDEDEEVLTSESDGSVDEFIADDSNFIVEDDEGGFWGEDDDGGMGGIEYTTPSKPRSSLSRRRKQPETPVSSTASRKFVKSDPSPDSSPDSRPEPIPELRGRKIIDLTDDTPEPEPRLEPGSFPEPPRPPAVEASEPVDSEPANSDIEMDSEDLEADSEDMETVLEDQGASSDDRDEADGSDQDEVGGSDQEEVAELNSRKSAPKRSLPDSFWQSIPEDIRIFDEERRLIERLWIIGETTRNEIHNAAKDCEINGCSFWDCHITAGLDPRTPSESISVMAARLFLYYAQPHTSFDERVFGNVRRKDQHKILGKKDCAELFISIILRVIPCFPKVIQLSALAGGEASDNNQVLLDARALQVREQDQRRIAAQDRRRVELREKLAAFESIPKDASRLIINETKEEDEGLIYIRGEPARLIKDHQIDGVRFLWNRIIANRDMDRQGCVLAHSMGLGKSMQVITLLLAVARASKSEDQSIHSQIPDDLRESRALILCPASLSQNWGDEFFIWDSQQELGPVYLIASSQKNVTAAHNKTLREMNIRRWAEEGGVLILGYELFVSLVTNDPSLAEVITHNAAIVVADEAHTIKNPTSKRRMACSKVLTPAKIALTGSPLSNNVTEYYSMVDWVAPQYMGPLEEFTRLYATPIQNGLYKGKSNEAKRGAYVLLRFLREAMAPRVHRCGDSVLREELKPKQEFMFFIPLTDVQKALYDGYVEACGYAPGSSFWGPLSNLTLICMHPRCFQRKVDEVLQGKGGDGDSSLNAYGGEPEGGVDTDVSLPIHVARKMDELMKSIPVDMSDIQLSWRFRLLFAILDECRAVGDKVLIFSRRMATLNLLEDIFQQHGRTSRRLDGQTPMLGRQGMIKSFNAEADGAEVFLISTKAGGVGLNIQGANRVIIMDFAHNPNDEKQAIGRAYRIGQEKPVFVYWFVSWGTHEAKFQSRLVYKRQLADRVVEGKDYRPWAEEDRFEDWVQKVWDTSPEKPLPPSEVEDLDGADVVVDRLINDRELSQGINSIVTTDTFEVEEDPEDVTLTAEEHASVSRLVEARKYRHKDEDDPHPSLPAAPAAGTRPVVIGMTKNTQPIIPHDVKVAMSTYAQAASEALRAVSVEPPSDEQVEALVQSIRREMMDKDDDYVQTRWRVLTQLVEQCYPNFAVAIFSRALSAFYLARTELAELRSRALALAKTPRAEFHLSMALGRRTPDGERLRMARKEDEIALREIADRRRQRQRQRQREQQERQMHQSYEQEHFRDSKLPGWASDALRRNLN